MKNKDGDIIKIINAVLLSIAVYFIIVFGYQYIESQNRSDEKISIEQNNSEKQTMEFTIILSDFDTANIKHAKIIKDNKTNELYLQYGDDNELYPLKNCNIDQGSE